MKTTSVALLFATAIAGVPVGTARAGQLRVTVYDKSDLPAQTTHRASQNLRYIFLHGNIGIVWVTGTPDADEATLVTYTNIVSREQEHRLACRARRDVAVAIRAASPSLFPQAVLGFALPFASEGINVVVYRDRITAAAMAQNVPESDLLAHAIAHEIGHVLLRSSEHAAGGLMAGIWKACEYSWIATGSMFFTPEDMARIRASMNGEGCQ
jgi:hypothetical protein